jgi:hypothetical protein
MCIVAHNMTPGLGTTGTLKTVLSSAVATWHRMDNGRAIIRFEDYVIGRRCRCTYVFQGMCYFSISLERLKITQRGARNGKIVSVNLSLQAAQGIRFKFFSVFYNLYEA